MIIWLAGDIGTNYPSSCEKRFSGEGDFFRYIIKRLFFAWLYLLYNHKSNFIMPMLWNRGKICYNVGDMTGVGH